MHNGPTMHILCWDRYSWRTGAGSVAHAYLWIWLLACMCLHQTSVRFFWLPSHVGIDGNEGANALAEQGRLRHPYNELRQAKRQRVEADLPRQSIDLPSECLWVHSEEGGVADNGASVSSEEGDEGSADESVSGGSADAGNSSPSPMDTGSSSDENE